MHQFSLIRTVTVGFGIAPNLLTPSTSIGARGLNGYSNIVAVSPPVGNFTPPREQNQFYKIIGKQSFMVIAG